MHYDWLAHERDPDGDGLLTIILPDESGLDDSPKYDELYGWMRHDRAGYFWLIERYRRLGYEAAAIAERYGEHVEQVVVNVCYALALRALPRLPEDVRRRIVEEHLLRPRRYRAACGIPSVALEEPSFKPGFALWRCWRGPSWMNTAWLLVPAMRELGYYEDADRVVRSLEVTVDRFGYREYYNPLTGRGLAARGFGFSTLLIDLLAQCANDPGQSSAAQRMMRS